MTAPIPIQAAAGGAGERDIKPSEALRKARELIPTRKQWTRGAFAEDEFGNEIDARSKNAVCFCMRGAIYHFAFDIDVERAAESFLKQTIGGRADAWNDASGRTHAEVLDAFRRAEELAISEGR